MIEKEILLCYKCKGDGKINYPVGLTKGIDRVVYEYRECSKCSGTGRILKTTTITPFKNEQDK